MKKLAQTFKLLVATLAIAVAPLVVAPLATVGAAPVDVLNDCRDNSQVCDGGGDQVWTVLKGIINLLITIAGIVSVIMIIVGGIKYSTSGGDAKAISSGKDTLVYAVVGLVISVMAFAIVNFVLGKIV
jgi:hypothetical protein